MHLLKLICTHHLAISLLPVPINMVSYSSLKQNTIWILTDLSFSSYSKPSSSGFSSVHHFCHSIIFVFLMTQFMKWVLSRPNLWSGFYHDSWPNLWKKFHDPEVGFIMTQLMKKASLILLSFFHFWVLLFHQKACSVSSFKSGIENCQANLCF